MILSNSYPIIVILVIIVLLRKSLFFSLLLFPPSLPFFSSFPHPKNIAPPAPYEPFYSHKSRASPSRAASQFIQWGAQWGQKL